MGTIWSVAPIISTLSEFPGWCCCVNPQIPRLHPRSSNQLLNMILMTELRIIILGHSEEAKKKKNPDKIQPTRQIENIPIIWFHSLNQPANISWTWTLCQELGGQRRQRNASAVVVNNRQQMSTKVVRVQGKEEGWYQGMCVYTQWP